LNILDPSCQNKRARKQVGARTCGRQRPPPRVPWSCLRTPRPPVHNSLKGKIMWSDTPLSEDRCLDSLNILRRCMESRRPSSKALCDCTDSGSGPAIHPEIKVHWSRYRLVMKISSSLVQSATRRRARSRGPKLCFVLFLFTNKPSTVSVFRTHWQS
jgi:hypothetical protein